MEKLRRFNLNYCDLSSMLENLDILLRISNIKINKNNDSPINMIVVFFWMLSIICYYYAYVFSMFWFVLFQYPVTGDFITACVMFSLLVCSQPSFVTTFYIIIYKNDVQNLIHNCLQLNKLVKPSTIFSKNLHSHLKHIKKRASVVWLAITINAAFYGLLPLAMPGRHLPEDNQIIYGLEPMFESPNFEIAYVVMGICVFICALSLANVTALNLVILGYVEAQMIALSIEIKNLWENAEVFYKTYAITYNRDDTTKNKIKNIFINESLKEIVIFHILNKSIIRVFEDVFRVTKAIELLCIILSIITELLGGIENTYLQMTCTFVLIFIECVAGQKLMDASCMFEEAIYDCDWENFDRHNMKILAIILSNAQKSLNITAGGMAVLNYRCFLSVIKFSYSVYNTLRLKV